MLAALLDFVIPNKSDLRETLLPQVINVTSALVTLDKKSISKNIFNNKKDQIKATS